MIKRILWPAFAALILLVSLVACGKKGDLEPPGKTQLLHLLPADLDATNKD